MRLAVLILFAFFGATFSAAGAEGPFVRITLGSNTGYIVPEAYAAAHKAELMAGIPGLVKLDGFWTPTEANITVAERVFRELLQSAVKDPTLLFPDLAQNSDATGPESLEGERSELTLVSGNYDHYLRQYLGIIVDAQKLVFCNYSVGTKADASKDYIFIQKAFVPDGTVHFLQCRFDSEAKTCSNVSMIGPWVPQSK